MKNYFQRLRKFMLPRRERATMEPKEVSRKRATMERNVEVETLPTDPTASMSPRTNVPTKSTEDGTPPKTQRTGTEQNLYEEYGLPSPPRGDHRRNPKEAIEAMIDDGFGEYTNLRNDASKVLFFLYGRGFLSSEEKELRVPMIRKIIDNSAAFQRAVSLVTKVRDRDLTGVYGEQYTALRKSVKAYFKQKDAFGMSEKPEDLHYHFRIQQQGTCFLLAPCIAMGYLMQKKGVKDAAPLDLTQYVRHSFDDDKLFNYLVKDDGGNTRIEFDEMLQGFASSDLKDDLLSETKSVKKLPDLEELLKTSGPCIVSGFEVYENFYECTAGRGIGCFQFSGTNTDAEGTFKDLSHLAEDEDDRNGVEVTVQDYHYNKMDVTTQLQGAFDAVKHEEEANYETTDEGVEVVEVVGASVAQNDTEAAASEGDETASKAIKPTLGDGNNEWLGNHAMVLIGGRRDESGKLWFLLQNTWSSMQLVEVSADYLAAVNGKVSFPVSEYEFAPEDERRNFSLNSSVFADANNLDRAEKLYNGLSVGPRDRANH